MGVRVVMRWASPSRNARAWGKRARKAASCTERERAARGWAAGEEVVLEVVKGALDLAAAFLVAGPADGGLEAIVLGEGQEGGMPARLAADPAQRDGGLVVIGDAAAEALVVAEGLLVGPEQR